MEGGVLEEGRGCESDKKKGKGHVKVEALPRDGDGMWHEITC